MLPGQRETFEAASAAQAAEFTAQGRQAPDVDSFRKLPQTPLEGWPLGYWQQRAYSTAEFWRVMEAARIDAEMLPIGSMGYAVDLSENTGWFAYCLDVSGYNTVAVSPYSGAYGLDAYPYARYLRVQASLDNPPLAKGVFDLVVFSFSLDSVENPQVALQNAAALLRKEGHLVVMPDTDELQRQPNIVHIAETTLRAAGLKAQTRRVGPMGNPVSKLGQTLRRTVADTPPLVIGRRL
jgi:SAM-dependent methyltransferase